MGNHDTQNRKLKAIVLAVFALLAFVWAAFPANIVFNSESVCLHYRWFGVQCPFCGLSRAGYSMIRLDLATAWTFNPLIYYIGWLYALEWGSLLGYPWVMKVRKISWWIGLGLAIGMYGIRVFT